MRVSLISLTILLLIITSSYVYSQTSRVTDKYGNELVIKSNPITNSVKRIYRVNAPTTRHDVSIDQINPSNIEQLGKSIIKDYEDILDISSDDLKVRKTRKGRKSNWHLDYQQFYKDVPVWRSFVRYTILGQGVVNTISADIHPDIELNVTPSISVEAAMSTAVKAFEVDSTDTVIVKEKPRLLIYPKMGTESITYHLTYRVELLSYSPSLNMLYFVDAHSGDIVEDFNKRRSANAFNNNGAVSIGYWDQNPTDTPASSFDELSGLNVRVSYSESVIENDYTDANGEYDIDWSGYYRQHKLDAYKFMSLSNSYARIDNANTLSHVYNFYPTADFTHDWTWTVDETNVFYHMNVIHDYITDSPFDFDDMDYQMEAKVHAGSGVNGRSDGTDIEFGTDDGENWARSSDIIYHEYTHCIVYQIYGDWIGYYYTSQGYAMDEGISDYFAGSLNNESRIGEYVNLDSYRNLDNDDTMTDYTIILIRKRRISIVLLFQVRFGICVNQLQLEMI